MPSKGRNFFNRFALLADKNGFVVGSFANDIQIDIVHAVFVLFKRVDDNGNAVRDFLVEFEQDFFAHNFGNHKLFALVRNNVLLENLVPFGHLLYQEILQMPHVFALARRNGENVDIQARIGKFRHIKGDIFFGHNIDFRIRHRHRYAQILVFLNQGKIFVRDAFVSVQHE